jgi:hypothetical protein
MGASRREKAGCTKMTPSLPEPSVSEKSKACAKSFVTQSSQYELNKPDDYQQCLDKQVEDSNMRSTSASKKRDVAQLGDMQNNRSPCSRCYPVRTMSRSLLAKLV